MKPNKTKIQRSRILLTALYVIAPLFVCGCMVVAVGAGAVGTVAYVKGDLEAVEAKDLDTVYAATLRAADELGLKVTKKSKDAMSAAIIARDAEDKKVTIKLKKTADNTTKLSIRIGVFGNERKSRLIYQAIQDNL
ncbi:MAG: DUF3568 family protein [Planctomycetota bacterium]